MKNRVRWKYSAVFGLEKTVLDRIPRYSRTVLKEECLYLLEIELLSAIKAALFAFFSIIYYWMIIFFMFMIGTSEMSLHFQIQQ